MNIHTKYSARYIIIIAYGNKDRTKLMLLQNDKWKSN